MEPLARIFGSAARLRLLRLFVFNQESSLTLEEVSARAKVSASDARGVLADFAAAGLLRKKGSRPARYQANPRFEHLAALAAFVRQSTSLQSAQIVAALKKAGPTKLILLSGLFTGALESQIDLLIVGDALSERSLTQAIHVLEAELGREIRYASFSTPDFQYRKGVYDRLIRDVFDYIHTGSSSTK